MGQLYTFIIWQSGFNDLSKLLWEISQRFEIKHAQKISWSQDRITHELNKIYPNRDFHSASPKLKEIGGSELVAIFAIDLNSAESTVTTTYKLSHRASGRNYLHISDSEEEALYNFLALTGMQESDFNALKKSETVRYVREKEREEIGLKRVSKVEMRDVFCILNTYENWVLLRNWENIKESLISDLHQDVDILTEDYYRTLTLLNTHPVFDQKYRVHYLVKLDGQQIPFDIRYVGDKYYDEKWEKQMLKNRVSENGIYRLNNEDYFWSLLYHAVFHKRAISEDYREKLERLRKERIGTYEEAKNRLKKYLIESGIRITKPIDQSVLVERNTFEEVYHTIRNYSIFFMLALRRKRWVNLSENEDLQNTVYGFKRARVIKRNVFATEDFIIKATKKDQSFLLRNEIAVLERLQKYDQFPRVVEYIVGKKKDYLILSRIQGKDLFGIFRLSAKKKQLFREALDQIVEILRKEHIIHRDIRPHNLMFSKDKLFLIDFQFAIVDNQEIQTETLEERQILLAAQKDLGGHWRVPNTPPDKIDEYAAENVKREYCESVSHLNMIRRYGIFLKENVRRYANYK